jgi:hypothetical protein
MRSYIVSQLQRIMIGVAFALVCAACGRQPASETDLSVQHKEGAGCKEISKEARSRLVTNVAKINLGDSQSSVELMMGAPDMREDLTDKEGAHVRGAMLYYVVRSCAGMGRVKHGDSFIRLYFHSDGSLFAVEAFGIDGVQHRTTLPPPPLGS